jgi:hypothetical protein
MRKTANRESGKESQPCFHFGRHPWRCTHRGAHSEIQAYVEASGQWETIAVVQPASAATAERLATYIVNVINEGWEDRDVLQEAFDALTALLREGFNFTTEQEAEHAIDRLRKRQWAAKRHESRP